MPIGEKIAYFSRNETRLKKLEVDTEKLVNAFNFLFI